MKIDLTEYNRYHWFEDVNGNVIMETPNNENTDDYYTYHCIKPCVFREEIDTYTWHPEYLHENNSFYQAMLAFKWFRRWMFNRMKKRGDKKTFKPAFVINQTFTGMSDCIVAMVNSGDYTLGEAIYICATACERCMNVLAYKYLDGKDGYAEHSDKWKKCNTVCDWCEDEDNE